MGKFLYKLKLKFLKIKQWIQTKIKKDDDPPNIYPMM